MSDEQPGYEEIAIALAAANKRLEAKVERLRADSEMHEQESIWAETERAKAVQEAERLRDRLRVAARSARNNAEGRRHAEAEVKRLKAELAKWEMHFPQGPGVSADKAQALLYEVERLRAERNALLEPASIVVNHKEQRPNVQARAMERLSLAVRRALERTSDE